MITNSDVSQDSNENEDDYRKSPNEVLASMLIPAIAMISGALDDWRSPSVARELIEKAIPVIQQAISYLVNPESAHNTGYSVKKTLILAKVNGLLLTALDAYDSDTKTVDDAVVAISNASKLIKTVR